MSTYNPNIPQPTDNLSTSQGQILNNFGQLEEVFSQDHFTWDYATASYRGMHQLIDLPVPQSSNPSVTGTGSAFYTKAVSGVAQAFFINSSGAIQLTGVTSAATNGYTFLPGGIIMQWNYISTGLSDGSSVSFPLTFPNNCFSVSFAGVFASNSERALWISRGSITTSGFTVRTTSGGIGLSYIAIGN
jgi:hypothetical protein